MYRIRDRKLGDDVKGLMETVKKRCKDTSSAIYRQRSIKRRQRFDALAQAGATLSAIPETKEDMPTRQSLSDSDESKSTHSSVVSWTPTNVRRLLRPKSRTPDKFGTDEGESSMRMSVDDWRKAIETAIITDNANTLQDLLKGFDARNDDGFSFLHLAILHKNEACARKLIRSGWIVNSSDDTARTPLHYAATQENSSIVSLLIKNGAKISLFDSQGMTPCMYAAQAGRDENLREMITGAKRSDIHMSNKDGKTALHFAAVQEVPDCIKHLARYSTPIDLSVQDNNYETPLHLAALGKHCRNIELLLEAGANPYAMAVDMLTPLHYSAFLWDTPTIKVFLNNQDLDINAKTKNGKTVLHLATMINSANISGNQSECVEFLLQCDGINVNTLDDTKSPPLGYAVEHDYLISKLLIQAGASVNACEKLAKNTSKVIAMPPLHRAVQANRPENVTLLLENNASVNIKNLHGKTALHVAMEEENDKCANILLQHGADPNITDDDGRRPMEVAIEQNNYDLICSILKHSVSEVPCIWTGGEATFKVTMGSLFPSTNEPETNLLKKINDSFSGQHKQEIFSLPVIRVFIELKEKVLKRLELFWIIVTLLYIGFSLVFLFHYLNCIFGGNSHSYKVTRDNQFKSDVPRDCTAPGSAPFIAWILWAVLLPFYLIIGILEFSANVPNSNLDICLDLFMLFSAVALCPWSFFSLQAQKVISVTAAITCALTLFLYLGSLVSCWRLHVLIFRRVLAAVCCILLVFFPLILCFGFTFNLIFRESSKNNDLFETFFLSLLYAAGDLQTISSYSGENKVALAVVTTVFLLFILIVMMNLFTGVSVLITSTLEKHSTYKVTHSRFLAIHSRERLLALLGKLHHNSLESSLTQDFSIKVSEHPFRHLGYFARLKYNLLFSFGCLQAREVWPMSCVGFAKADLQTIRIANKKKMVKQSSDDRSSFMLCDSESDLAPMTVGRRGELKMVEQRICQMQKKMEKIEDLLMDLLSNQDESC